MNNYLGLPKIWGWQPKKNIFLKKQDNTSKEYYPLLIKMGEKG